MDFSSPEVSDLRIVLLGKTGSGKSESGNTILGFKAFEAIISPSSVTKTSKKETAKRNERTVSVIDTPGIFDTSTGEDQLKNEIENCIVLSIPGPHVFLLVIRLDVRFTKEEMNVVQWIKDNFGEEAAKHTMVLFTRGDMLKERPVDNYLEQSPELTKLVSDCKAGHFVFDNTCKTDRTQVADLLEMIENRNHYTSKVYEEVQRKLESEKWWSKCGDTLSALGNYVMVGAAIAGFPVASVAPRRIAAVLPVLIVAGAGVAKFFEGWMKSKPKKI